jgi:hypothetical protein
VGAIHDATIMKGLVYVCPTCIPNSIIPSPKTFFQDVMEVGIDFMKIFDKNKKK